MSTKKKAAKTAAPARNRSGANKPPGTPKAPAPGSEKNRPVDAGTGLPFDGPTVKVRAIKLGFYDQKRIRVGDVFVIRGTRHESGPKKGQLTDFSKKWMRLADAGAEEKITPGPVDLKRRNAEALSKRQPGVSYAPDISRPNDDDPLGDEEVEEATDEHGPRQ